MELVKLINSAAQERTLLKHPFYRAWQEQMLTFPEDIQMYAGQFRHFEAKLPQFLSTVLARCQDPKLRQVILGNLCDEELGNDNHLSQFDGFCESISMDRADLGNIEQYEATKRLLCLYEGYCQSGHVGMALAAIYAYERASAEIAETKILGLTRYGVIDPRAWRFYNTHGELDPLHAEALEAAINHACVNDSEKADALEAFEAAMSCWHEFLDEINDRRFEAVNA